MFAAHSSALADPKTLAWYPGAFDSADFVIIPRVKPKKSTPKDERVYGKDVVESIKKTQPNVEYIPVDDKIIEVILKKSDENTLIIFMSSGDWGGLIESLLEK